MRTDSTEREGVHAVGKQVVRELKWIFREQLQSDNGIDAHLEIRERGELPTGRLIAMQIRSGRSYFRRRTNEGVIFQDDLRHLDYWLHHSLPVIIVLYNPEDEKCYWQTVAEENIDRTDKGWQMVIPFRQELNQHSKGLLESLTEKYESPSIISRLNELIVSYPLIRTLHEGNRVLIEFDEATGKHGYTEIRLLIQRGMDREELVNFDQFVVYPEAHTIDDIVELFPWAIYSVDEDIYYDEELEQYCLHQGNGLWDSEEEKYIYDEHDFSEWQNSLPPIRPYSEDEHQAHYRLVLTLNEIGHGFALLYPYLNEGHIPHRFLNPEEWDGEID